MIVSPASGALVVVTQADHARFAADLLRLMPAPVVASHPRREALLRAVAEHDNGWWESDAAPRRDGDRRAPLDFREVPDDDRRVIWRRGRERHAATEPYLAAMIAGHALRLLGGRRETDGSWRAFLEETAERRRELAETTGLTLEDLAADDRWLELADELSLVACTGEREFVTRSGWRVEANPRVDAVELAIDPFPFAGPTTLSFACRLLAPRSFATDAELAHALALLRWQRRPVRLVPLP